MAGLLEGRTALVTGAGRGIGRAIAVAYAKAGARLLLCDLTEAACADTLAAVRDAGDAEVRAFGLDVTDESACAALAARVAADIGHVDVLVNNAGILVREGIDSPRAHRILRQVMDVNLFGTFNAIHAFLPHLRASGDGHVVNISSLFGLMAMPTQAAYNANKFAVRGFTEHERQTGTDEVLRMTGRVEEIARAGNDPSVALRKESVWADACCAGHWTGNGADGAAEFVRAPGNGH